MTRLTVDDATLAKLHQLADFLELYDESGKVLGYFTPAAEAEGYRQVKVPHLDEEELRRREREPARTTAEILRDLENQQ